MRVLLRCAGVCVASSSGSAWYVCRSAQQWCLRWLLAQGPAALLLCSRYQYYDAPCYRIIADDTALVADSEEKLCRLVSEFGRVCERRKLRVDVCKRKVMRCSRGRMLGAGGSNSCNTKWRAVRGSGLF